MPKNPALEYEANVPSFLARLKANHSALDGRHNVQIPRARGNAGQNTRLKMDDDDGGDEPVMLDESGNEVSKEDVDRMGKAEAQVGGVDGEEVVGGGIGVVEGGETRTVLESKQRADGNVSSGFGKKRKAARVVGDGDDGVEENGGRDASDGGNDAEPVKSIGESTKDLRDAVEQNKEGVKKASESGTVTKKGKRKKVKLSFDEPE